MMNEKINYVVFWVCPRCGKEHSLCDYQRDRFCRICGSLLQKVYIGTYSKDLNRETLQLDYKVYNKNADILKDSIERTYRLIRKNIPNITIDSLHVVKQVELYRQFWKPKKINIILLAESHVYTDNKDYNIKCKFSILDQIIKNYPLNFVRFVYCLGYGENELLNGIVTGRKNTGTPQYWKIFSASVADCDENLGFQRILKKKTSFYRRLRNKIEILKKMKNKGIWLLDSSIVGLYGKYKKRDDIINKKIISICWDSHIKYLLKESNSKHIIIIGEGVSKTLAPKIQRLKIPFTTISQPQARGSAEWQLENYKKYQRICSKFL